jgi:hypothetical protein
MTLRWIAAGMLEAERQFLKIDGYRDLHILKRALERHQEVIEGKAESRVGAVGWTARSSTAIGTSSGKFFWRPRLPTPSINGVSGTMRAYLARKRAERDQEGGETSSHAAAGQAVRRMWADDSGSGSGSRACARTIDSGCLTKELGTCS